MAQVGQLAKHLVSVELNRGRWSRVEGD